MVIKCMVSCRNSNGEPDFHFVKVNCTESEYSNGVHYEKAQQDAESNGYENIGLAYDEKDSAGNAMLQLFEWQTAKII